MQYVLPNDLIDDVNELNNRTQMLAIPYCVENDTVVVDIPSGWTEHEKFAADHNLQEYVAPVTGSV